MVGKFIYHFRRLGLTPEEIGGDAAGKSILDKLANAGWAVRRQNFGAPAREKHVYMSWGAEAWIELGNKIRNREIIVPDNEILKAQLTTRKRGYTSSGKLTVEDKMLMHKRGLPSPDRADALVGAAHAIDNRMRGANFELPRNLESFTQQQDNREFLSGIGASAG